MRYVLIGVLLVLVTGCTCCGFDFWNTQPTIVGIKKKIDSQSAVNLVIDYSQKLEREHHLFLEDSNFYYDNEILCIELDYSTQNLMTIKEARRILVEMVEDLMERLNEDAVLADKLKYPFTSKRLQIYIDCQSFFGLYVDPFYVSWIILENGKSYFYAFDLKNHGYDFWHSRIEPFFKSVQIINAENRAYELYEASRPQSAQSLIKERYLGQDASKNSTARSFGQKELYDSSTKPYDITPVPVDGSTNPYTGESPRTSNYQSTIK